MIPLPLPKGKRESLCPSVPIGDSKEANLLTKYPPRTRTLSAKYLRNTIPSTCFSPYLVGPHNPSFTVTLVSSELLFPLAAEVRTLIWAKKTEPFRGTSGHISVWDISVHPKCSYSNYRKFSKAHWTILENVASTIPFACAMPGPECGVFLKAEASEELLK